MNSRKCSAFWKHTNIRSGNRIFPCCRFKKPVATFTGNVSEILNLPEYQELRHRSARNEYISECEKCYYEESQGKKSLRQTFNEEFSTDTVELQYLEIGFDNICNLACDGCWEEFSSKWAEIKNPNQPKKINVVSTKQFQNVPDTIKKVLFLGGEPLMTNRHSKFLTTLKNKNSINVIYNTNGTFLFKEEDINLFKKFRSVEVIVSIDAVGDLNDKVRSGSNWNQILEFLDQIKHLKYKFSINSVLHLNNWHGIADLSKFIHDNQYNWTVNVLTYPKNLDIINLTTKNKEKFLNLISAVMIPNKEYIIKHITQQQLQDE